MRKLIVLSAIAIIALGASPVLAASQQAFSVTGHLATASAGKCTSLPYPSLCPSGDNCVCYTAKKTSLHTASGGLLTIPPGTTEVAISVDTTDATSHPGCSPAWGEIHYTAAAGPDNATIEFFASLCKPMSPGAPQTFSGGGALTSGLFLPIPFTISGFGTATGTYLTGAAGQNLTLNLIAAVPGL